MFRNSFFFFKLYITVLVLPNKFLMDHTYIVIFFLFLVDPDFLKSFLLIHESCKAYGATPSRYMTFLRVYSAISSSKKEELLKRQSHLQVHYW